MIGIKNQVSQTSYNGWGDHANHTIPPFWLDDRPLLLQHVDVRPVAGCDGTILYCKICEVKVSAEKRFTVDQHVNREKHKRGLQAGERKKQQMLLGQCTSANSANSMFYEELCQAFVSANIPFHKLNNNVFRDFLQKYTGKSIPDESTIRKNYIESCYNRTLDAIRAKLDGKKIWVSIDETTDCMGRYVVNVIVGEINEENSGDIFLLNCEVLEKLHPVMRVGFTTTISKANRQALWKTPSSLTPKKATVVLSARMVMLISFFDWSTNMECPTYQDYWTVLRDNFEDPDKTHQTKTLLTCYGTKIVLQWLKEGKLVINKISQLGPMDPSTNSTCGPPDILGVLPWESNTRPAEGGRDRRSLSAAKEVAHASRQGQVRCGVKQRGEAGSFEKLREPIVVTKHPKIKGSQSVT
ncbi:hypothetical protein ANN_07655 [Periplaneta americana]|uniref:U1-type domain-containing protein n=1 Tax=Periplaneta americana TaxID=6978 RepID=A0ABQ8T0L6_PERAM|nr:hypothetical protein ANN_07655 [Periplaneta americana]